ncbi:MAG: efflux RND transporter permease subunit [Steroidobacteraceae bacterium]
MSVDGSSFGRFATRHALAITFIVILVCLGGVFAAFHTSSSLFPQTGFPRVVVTVSGGSQPPNEMMATVTRPIEEAMKSIPGVQSVRSATARGSAIVNVLLDWGTDMQRSELYVLGRVSEIRGQLPAGDITSVSRVGFTLSYPIIGISLTGSPSNLMDLWNAATYIIKPRLLEIPGVSQVDVLGGEVPEYHVVVDPLKLQAAQLALPDVSAALDRNNLVASAGLLAQNYRLYLTTVDGRAHSTDEIGAIVIADHAGHPIRIRDVAEVVSGPAPTYTSMTAQGRPAVLLDIESQSNASILAIASDLQAKLSELRGQLPPDMHLSTYYDQSSLVRDSVSNVWSAVGFGIALSALILLLFLKDWGSVLTAIITIPICVLVTIVALKLGGLSFNMMTLGGIAASVGLIIDDAIVVVEAMCHRIAAGDSRLAGIHAAMGEISWALFGSTITPVVVFLPLAFLGGLAGVFFRALGITMVVALLVSLVLALTLTPSVAGWLIRGRRRPAGEDGFLLRRLLVVYEVAVRWSLRHAGLVLLVCGVVALATVALYRGQQTDFLPHFDEGGFNIDFTAPAGTSLAETSRILDQAEDIIRADPDVEVYSRRLGTQLGPYILETNVGSYLIKLKSRREHTTEQVEAQLRHVFDRRFPMVRWDFHGFLNDLIEDIQLAPDPVEVRLFSPDLAWLRRTAPRVQAQLRSIPHLVDTFDGLTGIGPSAEFIVNPAQAQRFGLTTQAIADAVETALVGHVSTYVLQGDRVIDVRVLARPDVVSRIGTLAQLPIRTPAGGTVRLAQVATVRQVADQVELDRDNLLQDVTVSARLEDVDLGTAMREVRARLAKDDWLPAGSVQYAGQYQLQQQSFRNLLEVLITAILLVFTVLVVEFRSFREPIAIVIGAVLALFGTLVALRVSGVTLNIVSYLGAIIGVGIVAKNGILVMDYYRQLRAQGMELSEALVQAGHRRLRPVLMTSLAAALGMLPLAYGVGAGAQMLQPLGIAVIGALCISVVLSLIATPVIYAVLVQLGPAKRGP